MQRCGSVGGTAPASSLEVGSHSLNCQASYQAQTFFSFRIRSWRALGRPWKLRFLRRPQTTWQRASQFWFLVPGIVVWFATRPSKVSRKSWTSSVRLPWHEVSRRSRSRFLTGKGWRLERSRCSQPTTILNASSVSSTSRLTESFVRPSEVPSAANCNACSMRSSCVTQQRIPHGMQGPRLKESTSVLYLVDLPLRLHFRELGHWYPKCMSDCFRARLSNEL